MQLGNVQGRTGENQKGHQKAERKIKELAFQNDEDKKNQVSMSDLAGKLQSKIKTYKKQIEEAEEIAALNLAKFRKAQQELEVENEELIFIWLSFPIRRPRIAPGCPSLPSETKIQSPTRL